MGNIIKQKRYAVLITSAVTIVALTVRSFATGAVDTSELFSAMQTALQAILSLIGAGVAVFGIVHLIESQSSHDPNQKSAGIKELAAGLGVIIVGNILIPVFINMAQSAMGS